MIERMIDKSVLDGSFELSQHWMNPEHCDKVVITYNIDKGGNDINVSVRLLNRKEGNSLKYTYPIASIGGPVMECYQNEKKTIFNDKYPIGNILQEWVTL